ncbi:hypothetical protein [Micromonospora chalcea]|uniref:hypothetical protein n=1 Tax=Micromonospora chalcea TaxID=1874 RepID=UPI003D70889E
MAIEEDANRLRVSLLDLTALVAPLHEWLAGEVAYLLGQGFTAREARAMAAATYVTVFGSNIHAGSGTAS